VINNDLLNALPSWAKALLSVLGYWYQHPAVTPFKSAISLKIDDNGYLQSSK